MKQKVIAITGANGQTASYLIEKALEENCLVYGTVRKASTFNTERIDHLLNNPNLKLEYGDLNDSFNIANLVQKTKPDYFFNLGAISHVKTSFSMAEAYGQTDALGTTRCLEAIRLLSPSTKFLQASTSELFGNSYDLLKSTDEDGNEVERKVQSESTPLTPQSPYGCAKLYAYWMAKNYRTAYNLFAVNSISFNHESPRRNPTFVSRKITKTLCEISLGLKKELVLGNMDSYRSFNHVSDVVDGMWLMMHADKPDDYVIGDNAAVSVREFAEKVAKKLNLDLDSCLRIDESFYRPLEVNFLQPDASKIKKELGWKPEYSTDDLIDEMVKNDLKLAEQKKNIGFSEKENGFEI